MREVKLIFSSFLGYSQQCSYQDADAEERHADTKDAHAADCACGCGKNESALNATHIYGFSLLIASLQTVFGIRTSNRMLLELLSFLGSAGGGPY